MTFDPTCLESGRADFSVSADADTIQQQRPGDAFGVSFVAVYTLERVE
jgi:hypothetical protein